MRGRDVIISGEIRDREDDAVAISTRDRPLCLSTLHAHNANQTLDRHQLLSIRAPHC